MSHCTIKLLSSQLLGKKEEKGKREKLKVNYVSARGFDAREALMVQVGAEFLAQHYPVRTVLLPSPTWANHHKIFPLAGIKDVRTYRYYKPSTHGLDYEVRGCPFKCLSNDFAGTDARSLPLHLTSELC